MVCFPTRSTFPYFVYWERVNYVYAEAVGTTQWGICIKLTSRMQMPLVILKPETLLLLLVANLFLAPKLPLNAFGKDH